MVVLYRRHLDCVRAYTWFCKSDTDRGVSRLSMVLVGLGRAIMGRQQSQDPLITT